MSTRREQFSAELCRGSAREAAEGGIGTLGRAFNHCDNASLPYRYANHVQAQFFELAVQIVRLIEHGDIEPNPEHVLYRRAIEAKSDKTLQAVLRQARKGRNGRTAAVFKGQSN